MASPLTLAYGILFNFAVPMRFYIGNLLLLLCPMINHLQKFSTVRIHSEQQLSGKITKSKKQRKSSGNSGAIPAPIVESLTTSTPVTSTSTPTSINAGNPEDVVLNAVNSILPTEPLQRSELPGWINLCTTVSQGNCLMRLFVSTYS